LQKIILAVSTCSFIRILGKAIESFEDSGKRFPKITAGLHAEDSIAD
jgi:hypothetical protein